MFSLSFVMITVMSALSFLKKLRFFFHIYVCCDLVVEGKGKYAG